MNGAKFRSPSFTATDIGPCFIVDRFGKLSTDIREASHAQKLSFDRRLGGADSERTISYGKLSAVFAKTGNEPSVEKRPASRDIKLFTLQYIKGFAVSGSNYRNSNPETPNQERES